MAMTKAQKLRREADLAVKEAEKLEKEAQAKCVHPFESVSFMYCGKIVYIYKTEHQFKAVCGLCDACLDSSLVEHEDTY